MRLHRNLFWGTAVLTMCLWCGFAVLTLCDSAHVDAAIMDPCYWCDAAPTETACEDCCYTCGNLRCQAVCGNTPWYDAHECIRCLQREVGECIDRECRDKY